MITKFKLFENINEPEVNDYVICSIGKNEIDLYDFLQSHIGRIDRLFVIEYGKEEDYDFYVKFTEEINTKNVIAFRKEEIIFWSKNIEECETYLEANKYNL